MKKAITAILLTLFLASMLSMAFMVPAEATPDSGIVGLWHFDEGIGSTASDSSGYGNDGTLSGGKFGNALHFDGIDDYINIPDDPSLDITGDLTLEAWIFIESFSTSEGYHMYVIGKDTTGQRSYGIGVDLTWVYPNRPFAIIFHPGGSYKTAWGSSELVANQWYHLAGVFDATSDQLTLYVNGVPQSPVSDTSTVYPGSADVRIGGRQYPGHGCYFDGRIDEVRISDVARYSGAFTPATSPFVKDANTVGLWHLDESTGSTAFDESDNNNDGVINGATWAGPIWTTGMFDKALSFDGVDDYVEVPDSLTLDVATQITVEAWVKLDSSAIGRDSVIARKGNAYSLQKYTNDKLEGWVKIGGNWKGVRGIAGGITLTSDVWYHLAFTYDGTNVRTYVNGGLDRVGTVTGDIDATAKNAWMGLDFELGYPRALTAGVIDEVRIWNRVLTAEEAKKHAWGLVGEWLFEMGSGSTAYDTSGFGNQGTLTNMDPGTDWVAGKFGTALDFDGDNDYVEVSDSASLDVTDELTIEAWVYARSDGSMLKIACKRATSIPFYFIGVDNGKLYAGISDDTGPYTVTNKVTDLSLNEWHYVAMSYSDAADMIWLYLDGELKESVATSISLEPFEANLLIGAQNQDGGYYQFFDGIIDEVRIWNRALVPIKFDQTGLDSSAADELVVTVSDPIPLDYEDLPYVMMVESGTEVTYTYEQIVSSNIIGKSFSLDSVTGGDSPSETITVTDPTTITGNYVTQYETSVDIDPDTLNLKSNGQWLTCYIELPEDYDVNDIDVTSINLTTDVGEEISVVPEAPIAIGDYDGDGTPDLMVKFDRAEMIGYLDTPDLTDDYGSKFYDVELTVTGEVDGTLFEGIDTIKVIKK